MTFSQLNEKRYSKAALCQALAPSSTRWQPRTSPWRNCGLAAGNTTQLLKVSDGSGDPGVKHVCSVSWHRPSMCSAQTPGPPRPGLPPTPHPPGTCAIHKSRAQGIQATLIASIQQDWEENLSRACTVKKTQSESLSKDTIRNQAKGNGTIHCPSGIIQCPDKWALPFPALRADVTKVGQHQGVPEGRRESRGVEHLLLPARAGCAQLLAGNL